MQRVYEKDGRKIKTQRILNCSCSPSVSGLVPPPTWGPNPPDPSPSHRPPSPQLESVRVCVVGLRAQHLPNRPSTASHAGRPGTNLMLLPPSLYSPRTGATASGPHHRPWPSRPQSNHPNPEVQRVIPLLVCDSLGFLLGFLNFFLPAAEAGWIPGTPGQNGHLPEEPEGARLLPLGHDQALLWVLPTSGSLHMPGSTLPHQPSLDWLTWNHPSVSAPQPPPGKPFLTPALGPPGICASQRPCRRS